MESESDEEEWIESGSSVEDVSDEFNNSDPTNENFNKGDFVLILFPGKKKSYTYLCIIQNIIEEDFEVMALKCCNDEKTLFKTDEKDVSLVSLSQIKRKIDTPEIIKMGDRIKYKFSESIVEVSET